MSVRGKVNRKIIQKALAVIFVVAFIFSTFGTTVHAGGRDCDGNAIIYCGTLTKSELKNKLNNGTGKEYQSGSELQSLFGKFGFAMSDVDNKRLKDGKVTKDNKVYVGNTKVASNVYTFGRHNISGSSKYTGVSYPLYKRHPSVSFVSGSIDAYVYMNDDGSMAYAILKSCGNIVQGVGKRAAAPQRVNLTIRKYEDINHDGVHQSSEPYLPGWQFNVVGGDIDQTVTTDSTGTAVIRNVAQSYYTVSEVPQAGWTNSTGLSQARLVTTNARTQSFIFGNYQSDGSTPPVPTGGGDVTVLASAGVAENVAIAVTAILALVLLYYLISKSKLKNALRGKKTGTDPELLKRELRKRTKNRHKKILKAEAKAEKKIKRRKK